MQAKKAYEDSPVRYLKGVGPKRSPILEKLGIENISDLLYYLPRRYEDRSNILKVSDLKPGEAQAVSGIVTGTNIFRVRTGTVIFEVTVADETGRVFAVWYNQPYMKKVFSAGQKVVLYGRVDVAKRLQMTHPVFDIADEEEKESLDIGRIVPVYSLTESVTQKYMRVIARRAITSYAASYPDCLPTRIRARRKLVDFKFAVENIHFPHSFDNLEMAYRRLVFEEFFILQVVMALKRRKIMAKGIKHEVREGLFGDFEKLFSFSLTGDQKKCIKEIETDMAAERPMYRLLQGDVGSGKTVIAMYALMLACGGGYQAAMMAPTEILARQHYVTISQIFMPLGLNVRLLVGGMDKDACEKIKGEIARGEADIVIGTHSLIQEGMEFNKLGLAIIDEQHKFGVSQRDALRKKGSMPDTLFMTATPIPRSLALTVFGDMDISVLKEKPTGREAVTTYWVGEEKRPLVYDFVRSEISEGRQAFIVYPRINAKGGSDLRAASEMYEELRTKIFPDLKIALIHGKMKPEEKDKCMKDFRNGKYDILVATTVVEVGVDVPNVTVMVVEHADRYGLAQLHQLRGRIGRGKHQSYCVLIGAGDTEVSDERLSTMTETDDGFVISQKDMDLRGPGEFVGTRQSGLPEIRFGNLARDFAIMEEAREEAFSLVKEDPDLEDPHNVGIKSSIYDRFKGRLGF